VSTQRALYREAAATSRGTGAPVKRPERLGNRPGITGACLAVVSCMCFGAPSVDAQTFVQLTDLGSNIGPRLTRLVAQARISRSLFGRIGTKVTFIEGGVAYEFATDPDWSRVVFGRKDYWINGYTNVNGPGGRLLNPLGIDVSARRNVYVVDRARWHVLALTFDPNAKSLVNPRSLSVARPIDLAWDGGSTPVSKDFLYVLDDSMATVTYWDWNAVGTPIFLWSYGSPGSGIGQFRWPSGVCVGKTVGSSGGTQFTGSLYVVDRGNARLVWLTRTATGATWNATVTLPNWDPTDCAVDHFGQVYVVDQENHRIHKFNSILWHLDSYGIYGKGANNLNTFAWPQAISVPCGLKAVNNVTVWYCEGRVLTAEQWGDSSGAVEHYLGLDLIRVAGPDTSAGITTFTYRVTDYAYHDVHVKDWNWATVQILINHSLMPSGTHTVMWDGRKSDGSYASPGTYSFSVGTANAYCSFQSWCEKSLRSATFWFNGNSNCGPGDPPLPLRLDGSPPNSRVPCFSDPGQVEPTAVFLRQRIASGAEPLRRVAGPSSRAAPSAAVPPEGSLSGLVRQLGVRGLQFGITRDAAVATTSVRVYSLAGRLVRVLVNERLDFGVYEVGWDGLDDRGRQAAPGVYIAVMTVGSFRATQRLILRQP